MSKEAVISHPEKEANITFYSAYSDNAQIIAPTPEGELMLLQEARGRESEERVKSALIDLPLVFAIKTNEPWSEDDMKGTDAVVQFANKVIIKLQIKSSEWGINKFREICAYKNRLSLQQVSDYLTRRKIVLLNGQDDPKDIRRKFLFYLQKMDIVPKIQVLKEGHKYLKFAKDFLNGEDQSLITETGRFGRHSREGYYSLFTVKKDGVEDYITGRGTTKERALENAAYELCMKYNVPIPSEAIEVSTDEFKNDFVTEDDMDIDIWGDLETAETSPTS